MLNTYQLDNNLLLLGNGAPRLYRDKPHLAVLVAPPELSDGECAKWMTELDPNDLSFGEPGTGEWSVVEDHRKAELYQTDDSSKYELGSETEHGKYDGIGSIPPWLTKTERPSQFHSWHQGEWVLDEVAELNDAKEAKLRDIDRCRDQALDAGFEFDGHIYDSDQKSIQRISAIATLALMEPEFSTPYITKKNDVVQLDASAIAGLGMAAAQHESTMIFKARTLKDLVLAAATKLEVDAISWD